MFPVDESLADYSPHLIIHHFKGQASSVPDGITYTI